MTLPADPEPLSDDQVFDFKVEGIPIVGIIEDPKGGNMEITGPGPVSTRRVRLVDATWQDKRTISCDQIEIADDT